MANVLFPKFKEALLAAGLSLSTATIKAQLVDTGAYTYSSAHDFLDDVPSAARIGAAVALTAKTITLGVFDAADVGFGATTGATAEAIVIYNDTPAAETGKHLIAYIDTATGLPVTPNGGAINVTWHADGIFAL